jgi:hypothetical protein
LGVLWTIPNWVIRWLYHIISMGCGMDTADIWRLQGCSPKFAGFSSFSPSKIAISLDIPGISPGLDKKACSCVRRTEVASGQALLHWLAAAATAVPQLMGIRQGSPMACFHSHQLAEVRFSFYMKMVLWYL